MNNKICSACDKRFDRDKETHGGFGYLICDDCYHSGKEPLGYPRHWEWVWFDINNVRHVREREAIKE